MMTAECEGGATCCRNCQSTDCENVRMDGILDEKLLNTAQAALEHRLYGINAHLRAPLLCGWLRLNIACCIGQKLPRRTLAKVYGSENGRAGNIPPLPGGGLPVPPVWADGLVR